MNRTGWILGGTLAFVLAACVDHDHDDGHSHDDEHAAEAEWPTVAVTHWTERTELFLEYPVLGVGESARFAVHLTDLRDFSPLQAGEAFVRLRPADGGGPLEFRGPASRPGIYGVDVAVDAPGRYGFAVGLETPSWSDVHELGAVEVLPRGERPRAAAEEEDANAIPFLKEQQWTLEFATAPVEVRRLAGSIVVPAELRPRSGGQVVVTAPVGGRLASDAAVPPPGRALRAGAVLTSIVPYTDAAPAAATLRAELVAAEQRHALAAAEVERVERLLAERAVPERRRVEARAALETATAELAAARQRLARFELVSSREPGGSDVGAFAVRSPIDGVVAAADFAPGATVEPGEVLARIVDAERLDVVGAVPEGRVRLLDDLVGAELVTDDGGAVVELSELVALARVIDPRARTLEVRYALDNAELALPVGLAVRLRLLLGAGQEQPTVPSGAVVDDDGRPIVFVQLGGESFARRPVTLGARAGGLVQLLDGVAPGERVVTRGAYLVRLASLSSRVPAHGHVH